VSQFTAQQRSQYAAYGAPQLDTVEPTIVGAEWTTVV
jgi:hypothetical protein